MDINNKVLTIDDKKYLVIETVEFEDKQYVYLLNKNDALDSMFREFFFEENYGLKKIDPKLFEEKIYPLFIEKFQNY